MTQNYKAAAQENTRKIMDLGAANNSRETAVDFLTKGKTEAEFRAHLLSTLGEIKEPSLQTRSMPSETRSEMIREIGRFGFSINALIRAQMDPGKHPDEAVLEREISAEYRKEAIREGREVRGDVVPWGVFCARDLTVGTDTAGGFMKGTDHLGGSFIDALRPFSAVIKLGARTMNRLRGDVSIPAMNAKTTAYWVAENAAPTEGAPTFRQVTMAPKTIAAYVDLSRKLLIQSDPSVEQVIRNDLVSQIGTAIDSVAIEGAGSNEPTGILNTTGIGDVSLGTNGGAPTWDMVVSLIEDVQSADADTGRLGYLTNASVASKLARTPKVASTDSVQIYEGGNSMLGFQFRVTNNVPSDLTAGSGSALSAMIFGAWENLMIGSWGSGIDILVDPYSLSTTGATRVTAFADVDVALRHAGAFTACQDIVTT